MYSLDKPIGDMRFITDTRYLPLYQLLCCENAGMATCQFHWSHAFCHGAHVLACLALLLIICSICKARLP